MTDRDMWLVIADERRMFDSKCLRKLERFKPGSGEACRKKLIHRAEQEAEWASDERPAE